MAKNGFLDFQDRVKEDFFAARIPHWSVISTFDAFKLKKIFIKLSSRIKSFGNT